MTGALHYFLKQWIAFTGERVLLEDIGSEEVKSQAVLSDYHSHVLEGLFLLCNISYSEKRY